jgi:hypothetical protein
VIYQCGNVTPAATVVLEGADTGDGSWTTTWVNTPDSFDTGCSAGDCIFIGLSPATGDFQFEPISSPANLTGNGFTQCTFDLWLATGSGGSLSINIGAALSGTNTTLNTYTLTNAAWTQETYSLSGVDLSAITSYIEVQYGVASPGTAPGASFCMDQIKFQ